MYAIQWREVIFISQFQQVCTNCALLLTDASKSFWNQIMSTNRKSVGSWKLRSYLRSSSKLAWSGASDRESHKFVNINSAVANKKPCKTSMNISNLKETDIPFVLQQSKKQMISYRAVCLNCNKKVSRNAFNYLNQFWGNGRWINQLSSLSDLTALKTYNFIWKNGRKI